MELITLKIAGHNDTVIDLTKPERRYNFVVQNSGIALSLIDLYTNGGRRNTVLGQNNSGNVAFCISEISYENDGNEDTDKITMKLSSEAVRTSVNLPAPGIYKWNGRSLRMESAETEPRKVVVSIVSPNGTAVSLNVFVAANRAIYDAVLDFGSEASQISITRRNFERWKVDDILPVFCSIRDRYGSSEEKGPSSQYSQYERDVYYKSQFFIPQNLTDRADRDDDAASVFVNEPALKPDNERFKFLTKTVEENDPVFKRDYIKLPNVKISTFSTIPLNRIRYNGALTPISGFMDDYYYRSAINIFVHTILNHLHQMPGEPKRYVSLTVLMPNVYSQSQVSRNLRYMSEDMDSMLGSGMYDSIAGYEIQSISESDASFLGIMNTEGTERKDGLYLIMDAGKGTLDSSVVRVDNKGQRLYTGLFRFGSVGAGAALSYAVFVCLADSYLKAGLTGYKDKNQRDRENLLQEFIWKVILNPDTGPDLAELTEMLKAIDEYKRLIDSGRLKEGEALPEIKPFTTIDDSSCCMKNFTTWIKNGKNGLIDNNCLVDLSRLDIQIGKIVDDAMRRLDKLPDYANGIEHVIFSGRGFLLKRFKKSMYARLQKKFASIKELQCPDDMKNQCLKVVNSVRANHYDGRLVGKPYAQTSVQEAPDKHTAVLKCIDKGLGRLPQWIRTKKEDFTILNPDGSNPLVYGFKDKLVGLGDTIRVGNYNYDVNNDIFTAGRVELVFDGSDIWMRQRDVIRRLDTGQIGCVSKAMAFASLFPDVRPERSQDIPVFDS